MQKSQSKNAKTIYTPKIVIIEIKIQNLRYANSCQKYTEKIKTSKVHTLCKKFSFLKENFQESVNLKIRNFGKIMMNLEK